MPETNLPTLTSPLVISSSMFPDPFASPLRPRPQPLYDLTATQAQTAQPADPVVSPVVLLPETGGGLGGFVFAVVFVGFCLFAAWAGREVKR